MDSKPNHNLTIMVIEDERLLLEAITRKLKVNEIDVLSCSSGQQAIDYLQNMEVMPNAIWLDYYLQDMDGLMFMQKIRANEIWAKIPVIVVSNSAGPDKVKAMLDMGVKSYILKAEYRLDEIIKMIRDVIVGGRAAIAEPTSPPQKQE